jgi:uncharacterized membrane protein
MGFRPLALRPPKARARRNDFRARTFHNAAEDRSAFPPFIQRPHRLMWGDMASYQQFPAIVSGASAWERARGRARDPARVFLLLSILFGPLIVLLTPPLCGPDESAHFLRAYGLAGGEIVPRTTDDKGRKGVRLAAPLYRDFDLFEGARYRVGDPTFDYRAVMTEYLRRRAARPPDASSDAPVFVLYAGSEGYGPVPYLPYVAAALAARWLDLDFVETIHLMRLAGFLAMTAVAAYAIAIVPHLGWAFLCIAMLPAALYGRAMISADGPALASTMAVAAVCLSAAAGRPHAGRPWLRASWMTLCVLTKPPHVAFILLEAMARPLRDAGRFWRPIALVVVPGIVLTVLWIAVGGGDMATWRLTEPKGLAAEHFQVGWKIGYMIEHPLHFPTLLMGNVQQDLYPLWRQLIGILGWLDLALQPWVYPTASILLVATFFARLELDRGTRRRIALLSAISVGGYVLAVFLVFYVGWTPLEVDRIEGVQGRYFIVLLPAIAMAVAATVDWGPSQRATAFAAALGAVVSGAATIEGILRVDWRMW